MGNRDRENPSCISFASSKKILKIQNRPMFVLTRFFLTVGVKKKTSKKMKERKVGEKAFNWSVERSCHFSG